MRTLPAPLLALAAALGASVLPAPAAAQAAPACDTRVGAKAITFDCPLAADGQPRRYRFRAHFTGSHDDTELRLEPRLDGRPLACDPGSRTASEREDGDVTLDCRFEVPGGDTGAPRLTVSLSLYHAIYLGFDLAAD